jgi:hypothetical protein
MDMDLLKKKLRVKAQKRELKSCSWNREMVDDETDEILSFKKKR